MDQMKVRVIEGNVLQDGNVIDSIFVDESEKDELQEWIEESQKRAMANPDSTTEIYLVGHDHPIDFSDIHCDCAQKLLNPMKPYWTSEEGKIINGRS